MPNQHQEAFQGEPPDGLVILQQDSVKVENFSTLKIDETCQSIEPLQQNSPPA